MLSPAASKGATEAPTCIPLYKGTIYIMRWIYICGNRLLNIRVGKPETMHSPAASKGATEAPTCIPLYKGKIYI